jgi:hypothetical protein
MLLGDTPSPDTVQLVAIVDNVLVSVPQVNCCPQFAVPKTLGSPVSCACADCEINKAARKAKMA